MTGLILVLGFGLWLACVAQLVYVPIWASRLGRSGATWFMLTVIWGGAWAAFGLMYGMMAIYYGALIGALDSGADLKSEAGIHGASVGVAWGSGLFFLLPSAVSLLPTFVLAVAGRDKNAPLSKLDALRAKRTRALGKLAPSRAARRARLRRHR